ncbi:MAG: 16S rRNA (cytosine(1402)-N(4))-methyltransferase RsmH [Alphaproteobacteria bacterium]|jgi:16S rRNA (cytosine1402-N4)-methyltransferase|nr:16S rRNA (cytosine(1402)-N(4))-methyltransferase RsmH [Alphaproteobacteria bacterium]
MEKYDLHTPVLIKEIIETFDPVDNGVYIDCTFGAGGYTRRFLKKSKCKIIAFDRDENVAATAKEFKEEFGDRFEFFQLPFSKIGEVFAEGKINNGEKIDGIIFDIGVSSMQIDQKERGFSFRFEDAPLDMRMSKEIKTPAWEILKDFSAKELADIFYNFGDEKNSFRIANRIVKIREEKPFQKTGDLVKCIEDVVGKFKSKSSIQRVFQSLRIFVNDELGELKTALSATKEMVKKDGIVGVVTFHSIEDRIVKNFFKENSNLKTSTNRYAPVDFNEDEKFDFKIIDKRGIVASSEELEHNPRSHSARFRYAIRN